MYKRFKIISLLLFGFIIIIAGCKKEDNIIEKPVLVVNSFTMDVDGQLWKPSIISGDSCYSRFSCEWTAVDQIPFYTIKAFRDFQPGDNDKSENIFILQIMNVQSKGVYAIDEPYGDFKSYAKFIKNEPGNLKIYENSVANTTSKVIIEKMLPEKGSVLVGIKGSFTGVLYNVENQDDSIVIKNSKFTFNRINRYNFFNCSE